MIQVTPKITEYLKNLNLKSVEEMVKVREAHLLPPKKNHKNMPIIVYEKRGEAAWHGIHTFMTKNLVN